MVWRQDVSTSLLASVYDSLFFFLFRPMDWIDWRCTSSFYCKFRYDREVTECVKWLFFFFLHRLFGNSFCILYKFVWRTSLSKVKGMNKNEDEESKKKKPMTNYLCDWRRRKKKKNDIDNFLTFSIDIKQNDLQTIIEDCWSLRYHMIKYSRWIF